jgi:hypothetical protein
MQLVSRSSALHLPLWRWCGRRQFGPVFVEAMMSPPPMSLFYLLQFLTLLVSKLGSHFAVRVANDLTNPSTRVSPNISQLSSCLVDDWRNFRQLFRGQIEFGAEPVFHSPAHPLGMAQFKEMMPGV